MADKLPLGDSSQDHMREALVAMCGTLPGIGPLVAGVINNTIPNVRSERIETYLRLLDARIDKHEFRKALTSDEGLDIFEEGALQSTRAFNHERREHIAELVTRGLKSTDTEQQQARHFLRLLNQVDDRQIILLAKYHPDHSANANTPKAKAYHEANGTVINPGVSVQDIDDYDGHEKARKELQLNASMLGHLTSMGLLEEDDNVENVNAALTKRKFHINEFGKDFLKHIGAV